HRRLDDAGQNLGSRAALLLDHGEPELALAGVALLGLIDRAEPGALEEALDRLVRCSNARPALFFPDVGARDRQPIDDEGQPSWRRKGARLSEREAGRLQTVAHQPLEILGGARLHACRDLFAQKLEEK